MTKPIEVASSLPDRCPACGGAYVHIGHPLKPGVIMTSRCDCTFEVDASRPGVTLVKQVRPERVKP